MREHSVRDHNRFDLQVEVVSVDRKTGTVQYHVHPDPGRYEWQDRDGERVLYDRFDKVLFPYALVIDMLKRAVAMKPGLALEVIADIDAYVASRRPLMMAALRGDVAGGELVDLAEENLRQFENDELAFAIMSVDVVGSTKLKETAGPKAYTAMIAMLVTEIAELVALSHGHVLKYTGDGLIAYFAEPTFIIKNDAAVDCAFCVHRLVYGAINRELEAAGMTPIDIRIGVDSGEANIVVLGSPRTKRHADLIGNTVDLACKIEKSAGTAEIFLGETVHRSLHFSWRELCELAERPPDWTYSISGGEPYPMYRVDPTGTRPVERAKPSGISRERPLALE
jgi:adenylate cyclase